MGALNINLYTPYDKQLEVHKSLSDLSYLFTTVCASRQTGKTMLAQNQALKWGLENDNAQVMWVSPTHSQTVKVYKALCDAVGDAPFVKFKRQTQGDTEIIFTNGSVIKFKSAAAEDNLRGESVNYMILDEAAFVKESTFNEILLPMLNVAGKKCLVISTPKGRSNWFHKQYIRGVNGTKGYKSFKFNCYTNPFANPDIIRIAKDTMPEPIFKQEYLADFIDGTTIIENIEELCVLPLQPLPKNGEVYYAGIDLALANDYTVFSVVNSRGNVVFYDRFNRVSAPELKEKLVKNIRLWKPQMTLIETNNMGQVILDDLRGLYGLKNIKGWVTTQNSKQDIIHKLINAFSSKEIKLPDDDILKAELEVFEMSITSSGRVKFQAASGFHDDIPMSIAIALEAYRQKYKNKFNLKLVR
jgi:phage FluMu gp28-like protein